MKETEAQEQMLNKHHAINGGSGENRRAQTNSRKSCYWHSLVLTLVEIVVMGSADAFQGILFVSNLGNPKR